MSVRTRASTQAAANRLATLAVWLDIDGRIRVDVRINVTTQTVTKRLQGGQR